jgi:hypothetical protein
MSRSPTETAARFWDAAGGPEPFPRRLESAVLWALPVAIVKLPRLRVASVQGWLAAHDSALDLDVSDRRLCACLVAHRGVGVIFVDGADGDDEQRVSLAHETAHFLVDYLEPRERVLSRSGPNIAEVLDGRRQPTNAERIDGVLAGVPIGVHRHFLSRGDGHGWISRESRADQLALELLAPRAEVLRRLRAGGGRDDVRCKALLESDFGLPPAAAADYAESLATPTIARPSVRKWLGIPVELRSDVGKRK